MSQREPRIAHDLLDEPHIAGRRISVLTIVELLEQTDPGVGGELQLTDAIRKLPAARGVELHGDRYDIGNIPAMLQANIRMALHHHEGDMNEAVRRLLRSDIADE